MSILIQGMEMPSKGCNNCPFVNRTSYGDVCPFIKGFINKRVEFGGFPLSCPLVEVKDDYAPQPSDIRPIESNEEYEDGIIYINGEPVKHRFKVMRGTYDYETQTFTPSN